MRDTLFKDHPLCVVCQQAGRVTLATIRDHIIPLTEGGRDDTSNEQAICQACHDAKTLDESQRGNTRYRGVS